MKFLDPTDPCDDCDLCNKQILVIVIVLILVAWILSSFASTNFCNLSIALLIYNSNCNKISTSNNYYKRKKNFFFCFFSNFMRRISSNSRSVNKGVCILQRLSLQIEFFLDFCTGLGMMMCRTFENSKKFVSHLINT